MPIRDTLFQKQTVSQGFVEFSSCSFSSLRLSGLTITRPGETTRIVLHRSTAGSQPISGSVGFANGRTGNVDKAKIIAYAADGESSGKAETTTDARGNFELKLPGTKIACPPISSCTAVLLLLTTRRIDLRRYFSNRMKKERFNYSRLMIPSGGGPTITL